MVRRSGGACNERQSGYECSEGVVDEGVRGEEEVVTHTVYFLTSRYGVYVNSSKDKAYLDLSL
jgi:hypothetical protein